MRAYVYIDGFNLYYRALKGTGFKWLNIVSLAERLVDRGDTVEKVRYFSARVSPRSSDLDAPRRQQVYFSALSTEPRVQVHLGRFLPKTKMRPLVSTGKFVEIHDTEEKGSDVNLAVQLMNDGWEGSWDVAFVLSQDTDLIEPIRILAKERGMKVGLVVLDGKQPSPKLAAAATFVRHIIPADLAASQFPDKITKPNGKIIDKVVGW